MKIIQNTLKLQKKISNVSKIFWVGPKKAGSVGFPETRYIFFLALLSSNMHLRPKLENGLFVLYLPKLFLLGR